MRYLLGMFALAAGLLFMTQPAFACSGPEPTVAFFAEQAEIVVVGTLVASDTQLAVLEVEQVLKGHSDADRLLINNHRLTNDPGCRMALGESGRFAEDVRVLAFLQPDEFDIGAEWRPVGLGGAAIFTIEGDILRYPHSDTEFGSFQQALEEIHMLTSGVETGSGGGSGQMVPPEALLPPLMSEPEMRMPERDVVNVDIMPLPIERGQARVAPQAAAPTLPLPQITLGLMLALTAALLIWAIVQIVRRRPLH